MLSIRNETIWNKQFVIKHCNLNITWGHLFTIVKTKANLSQPKSRHGEETNNTALKSYRSNVITSSIELTTGKEPVQK